MNDTEGHVDILVCMAGTGGTGFGTASYLRSRNPNLQVVLVQPHPDSRLTPEHPDAQIIDGVLPAYDVPESALSDYLRPDWSNAPVTRIFSPRSFRVLRRAGACTKGSEIYTVRRQHKRLPGSFSPQYRRCTVQCVPGPCRFARHAPSD